MSMTPAEFSFMSRTGQTYASYAAHHMYDPPPESKQVMAEHLEAKGYSREHATAAARHYWSTAQAGRATWQGLEEAAKGLSIECAHCGAVVQLSGAGFWETGEDSADARRYCTDGPEHLHKLREFK